MRADCQRRGVTDPASELASTSIPPWRLTCGPQSAFEDLLQPSLLGGRRLVRTYPPDVEQKIVPVAKAALCPSRYGFDHSLDSDLAWPVVNDVVVALDLAQDQGRGREALGEWEPEGVIRVW